MSDLDGALVAIATLGLPHDGPVEVGPFADEDLDQLIGRAIRERVEGLMVSAAEAGSLRLSESQIGTVRRFGRARATTDLLLERETLRVASALEASGIRYRVLKGLAWAHTSYPDPKQRSFGDVDVIVEPDRWYEAVDALETSGARRSLPEIRPGFDGRFGKDATMVTGPGWEVDLHRTLVLGPYGLWAGSRELFTRTPDEVSLAGQRIPVLDPAAAFVHACYNAALADDPPRLAALRDVAQFAVSGSPDPEETFSLARRWRGLGVVRRAIGLVVSRLGLAVDESAVGRRCTGRIGGWDRVLMSSYRGPGRGYTSQLAAVVALPGLRPRAAYLAALARPQPAYLEARGFNGSGYLRHALGRVREPR